MLIPAKRGATYQDVLDAPEHMRAELIDGSLYLQARPKGNHQLALANLAAEIKRHDRASGRGDWVLLSEIELNIPSTFSPDISGWRRERFSEPINSASFTVVPDWICEVLSPSTRAYDRGLKADRYLKAGVRYLWFVDPEEYSLEAFVASEGAWTLLSVYTNSDTFSVLPFRDFWIDLGLLWEP